MQQPAKDDAGAGDYRADWSRQAARFSVISFFVCITLSCVINNLLFKNPQHPQAMLRLVTDGIAGLIIFGGYACGIAGLIGGIRKKSSNTIGIAIIGLVLHCGTLFVIMWGLSVLRAIKGQ